MRKKTHTPPVIRYPITDHFFSNSFQFGRPNPLSSTSYVQYCIDSLERSAEVATDFLLVKLVKFRQFIGRIPTVYQGICDMKWCREISEDASDELRKITKDLDDFMNDVSFKHPKLCMPRPSTPRYLCSQQ